MSRCKIGADVHIYIEYQQLRRGPWRADLICGYTTDYMGIQYLNDWWIYRHYELFGLMAGVRSWKRLYPARGLPDDLSLEVKHAVHIYEDDNHSHSWLTPTELKRCQRVLERDKYNHRHPELDDILTHIGSRLATLEADNILLGIKYKPKARIIFWFDS